MLCEAQCPTVNQEAGSDMSRSDSPINVSRLLRDLEREGTLLNASPAAASDEYDLVAYRGQPRQRPLRVTMSEQGLAALLDAYEQDDPQVLFPDRDRRTGAYFLVLARFDEELASRGEYLTTLILDASGFHALGTPRAPAAGMGARSSGTGETDEHEWQARPPD